MQKKFSLSLCIAVTAMVISACQPDTSDTQPSKRIRPDTQMLHDSIVLTPEQVLSVKLTRYQPSFELSGIITPARHFTVNMPTTGQVNFPVTQGESVAKGALIAKIAIAKDDALNIKHAQYNNISQTYDIKAPFAGQLTTFVDTQTILQAGTPILELVDTHQYKLMSIAPIEVSPYLKIGESVELGIGSQTYSGQISHTALEGAQHLRVQVLIDADENNSAHRNNPTPLHVGQTIRGHVPYGQMSLGALVPSAAIFDEALMPFSNPSLLSPPYKPTRPIRAYVWAIEQNQSLSLSAVDVIEYRPKTHQYLVSGINDNVLLVAAKLPKQAEGKIVSID